MTSIAERLKNLRSTKGVNQDTAAEACDMSRVALARYETGARIPRAENAARLADYYGVTVDYLLSDEEGFDEKEMLLQKAFDSNPDMRILFKVAEKCSPAEIKTAIRLIEALRGESHYEDK